MLGLIKVTCNFECCEMLPVNLDNFCLSWGALCPSKSGLMNKHIVKHTGLTQVNFFSIDRTHLRHYRQVPVSVIYSQGGTSLHVRFMNCIASLPLPISPQTHPCSRACRICRSHARKTRQINQSINPHTTHQAPARPTLGGKSTGYDYDSAPPHHTLVAHVRDGPQAVEGAKVFGSRPCHSASCRRRATRNHFGPCASTTRNQSGPPEHQHQHNHPPLLQSHRRDSCPRQTLFPVLRRLL